MTINWADVIARVIGDGFIITVVGFLIQYLINKQNLQMQSLMNQQNMEQEKLFHQQSLEMESKKRADYIVCRNYDEALEVGAALNQLIMSFFQAGCKAEDGKIIEDKLWMYNFSIRYKGKIESISMGAFSKQNEFYFPTDVCNLLLNTSLAYEAGKYDRVKELALQASVALSKSLGINRSKEEIAKLFELIGDK